MFALQFRERRRGGSEDAQAFAVVWEKYSESWRDQRIAFSRLVSRTMTFASDGPVTGDRPWRGGIVFRARRMRG